VTIVRVKGFQIFSDRHGKMRCYHRLSRVAVNLDRAPIGSPAFFAECARISAQSIPTTAAKPGTLGKLIAQYRGSEAFLDLAPRTQADYLRCLDYLQPLQDVALARLDRARGSHQGQGFGEPRPSVW